MDLLSIYDFFSIVISSNLPCISAVTRKINDECEYKFNEIIKILLKEITNKYEDEQTLACA